MMDIPYVFTATWIGLLGAYLLWMSQCSRSSKGTPDSPNFGFADGPDDADTASVTSNATEDTDEYPPFSSEGMISWMFERCNRRFEDAMQAGDTTRAQAYNQRRALLADFMNFIGAANDDERDQASDMLNTIDDISSHESSPTKDMDEGEDNRPRRMRTGRLAMINLQGAMAMQLQGCGTTSTPSTESSWFGIAFLTTWTMLLIGYSWYMMRSGKNFKHVQVPLFPDTLDAFAEPQVTHEYTSVEGLVTWTLVRVRGRLKRATEAGNIGAGMKYQQVQRWLAACLLHLLNASLENRQKTLDSLSDEYELSDDNSPTYNLGKDERNLLTNSHGEIHTCLVRLLELQRVETTMELLRIFAEVFKAPDPEESDGDE